MIQYKIPITGVKISTNKIYAGVHWSKRKQIKDDVSGYAMAFCRPIQEIESYPVEIRYRFLFRTRPLDTLNTAYMSKMFEDSLVSLGVIKDDTPRYVARAVLEVPLLNSEERSKEIDPSGEKNIEEDEDWLIITINKI